MAADTVRALAVGIVALALSAAPGASDGSRSAFGVGVLRRDGIIIPFGAFDGKRWSNSWPLPALELTIPIGVRGVPSKWWGPTGPLEAWQVWRAGEQQQVHVVQTDWVDVHCTRQIGLRSDYTAAGAAPPRTEQPYPKDGLAVSPPQPVQRIAVLPADSAETRALIPAVREAFNLAERKTEDVYHHPLTRRSREGRDPDMEAVYAAGDHPRIYYVEAARRYRKLGQRPDECEAVAFGAGWFAREGADIRSLETVVDLLECNRAGAGYMLPLGVLRLNGKVFWLVQFSGWKFERFAVIEIKQKSVQAVLSAWGGSCPR